MPKCKMETYYNSNRQFRTYIKTFVQDTINKSTEFQDTWEFFEYDGKYFDVHIFKNSENIKANVYWTSFRFLDQQDLYVTQMHDVMPLGYFPGSEKGTDYVA